MSNVNFSEDMLIAKMLSGSHAYGMALPTSDIDIRGIFVAPPRCIRTPFFTIKEQNIAEEEDTKYYELNQLVKLAVDCNPNIIELIWCDESSIILDTPEYKMLREAAPKLLSSKIAFTTSGYALAQLKRIKGHKKWLNNPQPVQKPQQKDYVAQIHNFTNQKLFKINIEEYCDGYMLVRYSGDTYGIYKADKNYSTLRPDGSINPIHPENIGDLKSPLFLVKFNREVYEQDLNNHTNYWTWKNNRNAARNELEERFGYDSKHATHLVRLMRMGKEALETGVLNVKRPDADELLSIRNGAWSYEQIVEYAEKMDKLIREDLYQKTKLPKYPDLNIAADLIMKIQDSAWNSRKII